jgi:PAS domain S-box-containing protein
MASSFNRDDRFFNLSLELLCIASMDGSFQRLNPAFSSTLGYSPEEMLARPLLAFVHPVDKPGTLAALEGLRSGQPTARFENRYHCKDGSWKWLSWKTQAFPEEGLFYAVARDITEHQQTEKSLVESHRLLQTIIDTIPMRIFWKDKDCRYLGCNPAFARDAGEAHPEDLIGKDDYQLSWRAQADLYRADDQQVMASGIPKLSYEEPGTTPDGHSAWLRTSKVPLHDEENQTIGVLGLYEDITEHKLAKQQLETELREKETLLREVHHRVKNNLQIISSLLHFQAKKAQKEQELAVFRDGQDRLRAMILVHEKLYRSADLHRISLGDYIHALAAQLHRSFLDVAEPIELRVEAEEIYVPVEIALPCGMIATELVTNAFKYAYPAGESGAVLVRIARRESSFVLSVADTGSGLLADLDLEHATSFGLQLVANLTAQLSATLTRAPGRGTVMCLEVPWPAG